MSDHSLGLDVRDVVRILFRRFWVLPVVAVAGLAGAYLALAFLTPVFEAEGRVMVVGVSKTDSPISDPISLAREVDVATTIGESMRSRDLLRDVVRDLKLQDRDEDEFHTTIRRKAQEGMKKARDAFKAFKKRVKSLLGLKTKPDADPDPVAAAAETLDRNLKVEAVDETDLISIHVSDYDPSVAEAVGDQLVYRFMLQSLRSQAAEAAAKYGPSHPLLLHIRDGVYQAQRALSDPKRRGRDAVSVGNMRVIQSARAGTKPKKPKRLFVWAAGLFAGLAGGVFMVFLLELLDPSVRDLDDLRRLVAAPVLGAVPARLLSPRSGPPRGDDAVRLQVILPLALHLRALGKAANTKTLAFTALGDGGDNRTLVRLLAFCLGRLSIEEKGGAARGVLLVESSPDEGAPADGAPSVRSLDDSLSVASLAGGAGGRALAPFSPGRSRDFLRKVSADHDLVLVEGPNLAEEGGFLFLNGLCDATVLVVSEGRTRRKAVLRAARDLELQGVRVLGAILSNQRRSIPGFLYHVV